MSPVVKVLQPSGILDGNKGNQLRREIGDVVETGADIVLIDLENITFMDSSGLGTLVSALKTVRNGGGEMFVCSVNEQVKMLFELTRMDRVLKPFANREAFNKEKLSNS